MNGLRRNQETFSSAGCSWKDSLALPCVVAAVISVTLAFAIHPQASGLGVWYEEFAGIIRSGFITHVGHEFPSFPMWGYGFMLVLLPNVSLLVVVQIVAGLVSTIWLFLSFMAAGKISRRSAICGMWIVSLLLPWHAVFVSGYSAPAIGVSLMIISLGFLVRYLASVASDVGHLYGAALAFGLCLNFRSDYFVFAIAVGGLLIAASCGWKQRVRDCAIWFALCGGLLLPWMIYTHHVAGGARITSTNSGHVLFLSWGDLPRNPWGIQVSDNDPVMAAQLKQHFGEQTSSLSAKGDRFLREEFIRMVLSNPALYAKRVMIQTRNIVIGGFYPGGWDSKFREQVRARFPNQNLNSVMIHEWRTVMGLISWGATLTLVAELQARLGLLVGLAIVLVASQRAIRERDLSILLLLAGVAYQFCTSMAAHYLRPPLNNQIVPIICIGLWFWCNRHKQVAV